MRTKSGFLIGLTLLLIAGSANAALISRASGQAYYDTVLNITWLANAGAADGSSFDDGFSTTDGLMTWSAAQSWIASLNTAAYLGVISWRLPQILNTAMTCPPDPASYTGGSCGYNGPGDGEVNHFYYSTLGNIGYYDTSGTVVCTWASPNYCMSNPGPFTNLQGVSWGFWNANDYAPDTSYAWRFDVRAGYLGRAHKTGNSMRA